MSYSPATFDQPSSPSPVKRRSWLWFILPAGCLTVLLVCCGGFSAFFYGVMGILKSSPPYQIGLERAKGNPEVKEALGEPIAASFIVAGSVDLDNDNGNADLNFPITGPKGTGSVHVKGTKNNGVWSYEEISVTLPNSGKSIDLSDEPASELQ